MVIVAKDAKFIYYQLTDKPNTEKGPTSYGGYTIKIKAAMTSQLYNFGSGSTVPIIGNDTDAFLVTTTELYTNSAFVPGAPKEFDLATGAVVSYLIHLFDMVESYNIPSSPSAGRKVGVQMAAPDGTPLMDDLEFVAIADSSSSTDCKALAMQSQIGQPRYSQIF